MDYFRTLSSSYYYTGNKQVPWYESIFEINIYYSCPTYVYILGAIILTNLVTWFCVRKRNHRSIISKANENLVIPPQQVNQIAISNMLPLSITPTTVPALQSTAVAQEVVLNKHPDVKHNQLHLNTPIPQPLNIFSTNLVAAPDKFTKKTNVREWLTDFEAYLEATNIVNKKETLIASLDPECRRLLNTFPLPNDSDQAYQLLKQAMSQLFFRPEKQAFQYRDELSRRYQQADETVMIYAAELYGLASKAYPDVPIQCIKRFVADQFLTGLRDYRIRNQLVNISDPDMIIQTAQSQEQLYYTYPSEQQSIFSNNNHLSNYYQFDNTNIRDPRVQHTYNQVPTTHQPKNLITNNDNYQPTTSTNSKSLSNIKCYNCNKFGHYSKDCKAPKMIASNSQH